MKDTSVTPLKSRYILHSVLISRSHSSVESIHGASSDAMHSVCDSVLAGQTVAPLTIFL